MSKIGLFGKLFKKKDNPVSPDPVVSAPSKPVIPTKTDNFKVAGGLMEGKFKSESPFDDSDVSKVIEGAAYALSADEDPELEAYVDSVISYMKAAQEEDGYLYTYRTIMGNDSHPVSYTHLTLPTTPYV